MTMDPLSGAEIVALLDLRPHPEGGHYRETYRDTAEDGSRGAMTAIFYLLQAGEVSHWHRVTDAAEIWHFYAGASITLKISADGRETVQYRLGNEIHAGAQPQILVPAGHWQSAESTGAWTLAGCTVAPAFRFEGFELAPPGWQPGSE